MANTSPNLKAGGNIRTSRFMTLSTTDNHTVTESNANEAVIGISGESNNYPPLNDLVSTYYHAESGQPVRCYGEGDVCFLTAGGSISAGDRLKSDNDGRGVEIESTGTTIQNIGARALEDASTGELFRVQVLISSERPALT